MDVRTLLTDENFVKKMLETKTEEEALALFRSEGVETTMEEIASLLPASDGELDDSALEGVAGGQSVLASAALGGVARLWKPIAPFYRPKK